MKYSKKPVENGEFSTGYVEGSDIERMQWPPSENDNKNNKLNHSVIKYRCPKKYLQYY